MKLTIGGFYQFLSSGILFLAASVSSAQSPREFYISNDPSGIESSSRQSVTLAEAQSQSSAGDIIYLVNLDPEIALEGFI